MIALIFIGVISAAFLQLFAENSDVYDRLDLLNRIADSDIRHRRGDNWTGVEDPKGLEIAAQLRSEFVRCSGPQRLADDGTSADILLMTIEDSFWEARRRAFRWAVAERNNIVRIKSLQICRSFGKCAGDWWTYLDHPSTQMDQSLKSNPFNTDAGRLQIAKDYACGMAARLSHKAL
jgi:hypothetical protein